MDMGYCNSEFHALCDCQTTGVASGPGTRETVFTCLYPNTVQTRLSRDQRPTKPVSRLGTGRGVGGS